MDAIELEAGEIVKRDGYSIQAIETDHSVPCIGYALVEDERTGRCDVRKPLRLECLVVRSQSCIEVNRWRSTAGYRAGGSCWKVSPGRKVVYSGDTRP